jgi:hypothetical protein
MNQAVDNADAGTNKGNQDKTKNQLIVSNSTDKRTDPRNGRSDPATDIGEHSLNGISGGSSLKNHTFQKIILYSLNGKSSR